MDVSRKTTPQADHRAFIDALSERFAPGRRTLPEILVEQAGRYGERRLAVFGDVGWTYGEAPGIAARASVVAMTSASRR